MIKFLALCPKADLCLSEALSIGQLSKRHAQILIQTTEGFDLVISIVCLYATAKNFHGYMFHDLGEDKFACMHDPPPTSH